MNNITAPIIDAFQEIGYKRNLIQKGYKYTDFFSTDIPVRTIDIGIFGHEPFDYRSACFGLHFSIPHQPSSLTLDNLKAFGAPQVFIINNNIAERWIITESKPESCEPLKLAHLPDFIRENKEKWNPKEVIRAKSGFESPGVQQLDFVDIGLLPALEVESGKKIDFLIRSILNQMEDEFSKQRLKFDASMVFHIVFRLLAAKLLKDRNIPTSPDIDFSEPAKTLSAVDHHYGRSINSMLKAFPNELLLPISREIGNSFPLCNMSVDTLTYIYENTFVSFENRKYLGIYSTPSYVADYVLSQIPLQDIPPSKWNFLDPMCGHSIFLIAAMRRMRELLPSSWGGQRRHKFFIDCLHGIEIDSFSVEIARLCLMLADFPKSDGWDIQCKDAFSGKTIESAMAKTTILVGNPPFEILEGQKPDTPKPKELLRRAFPKLPEGAWIGLVLPRSFMDGSDYKKERETFLQDFEIESITALPDRIFLYAKSETSIIVGRKKKEKTITHVKYREVRKEHIEDFRIHNGVTWEDTVLQSYFIEKNKGQLIVPLFREIWEYLEDCPRLGSVADIRKGAQYDPKAVKERFDDVVRDKPFPGAGPGIFNVTDGFIQFVASDTVYMSTEKSLQRRKAWNYDWVKPKVILPTSPLRQGPWRYAAAIDTEGRIVSSRFFFGWQKSEHISIKVLAALLNSPIAQVFVYSYGSKRDITKRIYASIPIPHQISVGAPLIDSLVTRYLKTLSLDHSEAKKTLMQIDAEILKLYNLPPRLERKLLNLFWGEKRRVPFDFIGYIPPEMDSWIPLHVYISEKYKEATPENVLKRVPKIQDKDFVNYLKGIGRE